MSKMAATQQNNLSIVNGIHEELLNDLLMRCNTKDERSQDQINLKRSLLDVPVDIHARIEFKLNDNLVSIPITDGGEEKLTLASYLRDILGHTGTKISCGEGGCGACTVLLKDETVEDGTRWLPINSCLRLLGSCHGQEIMTAEGIGGSGKAISDFQSGLADGCGSQCGFCSPGMIASGVALHSKLLSMKNSGENKIDLQAEVEKALDGNLCRCTGYLPILSSFRNIIDSKLSCEHKMNMHHCDIEDMCKSVDKRQCLKSSCAHKKSALRTSVWETPSTVHELLIRLRKNKNHGISSKIIAGNTSIGVSKYYSNPTKTAQWPSNKEEQQIDIQHVPELKGISFTEGEDNVNYLDVGSAVTLKELSEFLSPIAENDPNQNSIIHCLYKYISTHVANTPVRSCATVGGNIILASQHAAFASDIALAFTAAAALAVVKDVETGKESFLSIGALLSRGILDDLLLGFTIPISTEVSLMCLKVAKRRVNAHAVVNFGMSLSYDPSKQSTVTQESVQGTPIIVVGGITTKGFIRATNTENYLEGKDLRDENVLQGALECLSMDLMVGTEEESGDITGVSKIAMGLFYRAYLRALPSSNLSKHLMTAAYPPSKAPTGTGVVSYDNNPAEFPVSKGMVKLSATLQTSGEAKYTDDLRQSIAKDCLYVSHVLSAQAYASIRSIDVSEAVALDNSVMVIDYKTLERAGIVNNIAEDEYILAPGYVTYNGQYIALVTASTEALAVQAAELVRVEYEDIRQPILTIDDAIAANSYFPDDDGSSIIVGDCEHALNVADTIVCGEISCGHQYHFYMETQTAIACPTEGGGVSIHAATQSPTGIQAAVANALQIASSKISVQMKRAGGAYGGKGNRSIPTAVQAAIIASLTRKPVRVRLDINTNMKAVGSRRPHKAYFKAAISNGMINGLDIKIYNLQGAHSDNGTTKSLWASSGIDNMYSIKNWNVIGKSCRTNTPANTYTRAPSFLPGTFIIESIMDNVAEAIEADAFDFRSKHFYKRGDVTPIGQHLDYLSIDNVWRQIIRSSNFQQRAINIDEFNASSRFIKRGIAITPMKYGIGWQNNKYASMVNIYDDGTVLLSHAGCEVGQGIDVKVAQVASFYLGCPIDHIQVSPVSTLTAPNSSGTGGSHTSENNSQAVKIACMEIVGRLSVIENQEDKTWSQIIKEAVDMGVNLQAVGRFSGGKSPKGPFQYCSYGAAVNEVQVDCLTGEAFVIRSDLLVDCGVSLNPLVDLGQAQGAFMMGLGYMLTEEFAYDRDTGRLVSDGTWEYKPPSASDIPSTFNVSLLKDASNPLGFMQSKSAGEPPLLLSIGVISAIRTAINAFNSSEKAERGFEDWVVLDESVKSRHRILSTSGVGLDAPATPQNIIEACKIRPLEHYSLH